MEDLDMDTSMAPASITMDRQLTTQQPSNAMAGPVAAAAGVTRISTPVSMSILDLIMLDHNCVRAMYDAYMSPAVNLEQKQLLAWEMIMALSVHAAKEELVVYPVVRSTLGGAAADKLTGDHQLVKSMLNTLDTLTADHPDFDSQLRSSLDLMMEHMKEEEQTTLPQLSAVLDVESQLRLGILFEAAKVRAPTRPHPEATALPAPFFENQLAATKLVDASLDQARMPALTPTAVGLSPLASAAVMNATAAADTGDTTATAAAAAAGATDITGGLMVPQSMGMPAMPPATPIDMTGVADDSPLDDSPPDDSPPVDDSPADESGLDEVFLGAEGEGFVMHGEGKQGLRQNSGAAAGFGFGSEIEVAEGLGMGLEVQGLLAEDAGPLGAGVDPDAVPYIGGGNMGVKSGVNTGVNASGSLGGNLKAAGEPGAYVVPDFTDVGVGGVAGVPASSETAVGVDTEMGAAGGMPGDLTAVTNAPVEPAVAAAAGGVVGGSGGDGGLGGSMGEGGGSSKRLKASGGDFADDIGGTDVEAVKDGGQQQQEQQQDLAPSGVVE